MRCYYIKDPLEEESLQSYEPKLKDFWKKNTPFKGRDLQVKAQIRDQKQLLKITSYALR